MLPPDNSWASASGPETFQARTEAGETVEQIVRSLQAKKVKHKDNVAYLPRR